MNKINKANIPAFLLDVVKILADYGIQEDQRDAFEYNSPDKINPALMLCYTDKSKLDKYLENTQWNEEYNMQYDDEVFTLPLAICDILKKYNLVADSEKKKGVAVDLVETESIVKYISYKCPHCGRSHRGKDECRETVECSNCYGVITLR